MRILHFTTSFYPAWSYGGQPRIAYELCKRLTDKHKISVYTTDVFDKTRRIDIKNNPDIVEDIEIYRFTNLSNKLANKRFHLPISLIDVIKRNISNYDLVHIHGSRSVIHPLIYHYIMKNSIPYVLQAHGSLPVTLDKKNLKNIFDLIYGNKLIRNASKAIALTETEADLYKIRGINESKIEILPNGLNLTDYENLPNEGLFKSKYGIKNNEKLILYIGRIHKTKGIDLIIRSFYRIAKERNDVHLAIIGPDDDYKKAILSLISKLELSRKCLVLGYVSQEEKIRALVDSDVFVTPRFSGFPVTFLEACACRTALVTTSNGDRLDWINNNVGFVVDYDEISLENAICKLINDEALRKKFGENGRRLVKRKFNWEKIIEDLNSIYYSITPH